MLRLHADCPTTVERGEESVVAAEIHSKVVEGSTGAQVMKTTPEQAPKVRIVQVSIPLESIPIHSVYLPSLNFLLPGESFRRGAGHDSPQ